MDPTFTKTLIVSLQICTLILNSFFLETHDKSNTVQMLKLLYLSAVFGTSHVESMIVTKT